MKPHQYLGILFCALGTVTLIYLIALERRHVERKRIREANLQFWTRQCDICAQAMCAARESGDDAGFIRAHDALAVNIRRYEKEVLGWK